MLPASRIMALRRTSKTMQTIVEKAKADAVVQARGNVQFPERFPDGRGLVEQLNGLSVWCKVTVLCLNDCSLGRTEAIGSFSFASLVELNL